MDSQLDNQVSLITELNFEKDSWTIKVCVIRLWKQPDFKNPAETFSIEMVLVDEKGTRIQANVYKSRINDFQHLLQEGSSIYIKDFAIGANTSNYKYCDHPHKLNFIYKTKVTKCSTFNGSVYGFALCSYQSIKSNDIPDKVTVDIIGDVVRCGKIDIDDLKKQRKVQLEMQDLTGVKLNVTLWDGYADKMSEFVNNRSLQGRVIMLLQFGRVKWFDERPYISNSYKVSKLFINSDIEEINNFKNSLLSNHGDDSSFRLTITSKHDDLIGANERKDIAELIEIVEKKTCIVVGTVKCIPQNEPWYYVACKYCSHKAKIEFISKEKEDGSGQTEEGQVFRCDKCKERVHVVLRFRILLRVQDATGIVSLTLWDRDAKRLLNKSASELLAIYEERGDMNSFPVELNDLVERKFVFRVEVTDWNIKNNKQVYGISKLTVGNKVFF